jgi:maltokinase
MRGAAVDALELPGGPRFSLLPAGSGWDLQPASADAAPGSPAAVAAAARWLVERLLDDNFSLPSSAFRLNRFSRPGFCEPGERPVTTDQTNQSVIVGERVVVKWLRRVDDAEHPALTTLAHLAELGFTGAPATFGALTWRTPGGREVPLGFATAFLPQARDGWEWCLELLESDLSGSRGFPADLGRLTAQLHTALATPSSRLPAPIGWVEDDELRRWQASARLRLSELAARIGEVDGADAGPAGDRPQHRPSTVIAAQYPRMEAVLDRLSEPQGPVLVQRVHGDLHVGQMIRWSGGLAVIDFDGNPVLDAESARQSPARDVAQLLLSLDQVGRIADRRSGYTITSQIDAWSRTARAALLTAYRDELAALGRPELFDVQKLPSFLVEQATRDLLYSLRFLPRWAYATIDGLDLLLTELEIS